jgi:iron complex transport system substrate-binding protein
MFSSMILCSAAFCAPPVRIVSLAPSITEILYDLGLEDRIAAVTVFCDYPKRAKDKPKIGGFANPSLEAIISARPDLVLMME